MATQYTLSTERHSLPEMDGAQSTAEPQGLHFERRGAYLQTAGFSSIGKPELAVEISSELPEAAARRLLLSVASYVVSRPRCPRTFRGRESPNFGPSWLLITPDGPARVSLS